MHQNAYKIGFLVLLEFTPLEFETYQSLGGDVNAQQLEFTPLEFETSPFAGGKPLHPLLEFTPLEFETFQDHLP